MSSSDSGVAGHPTRNYCISDDTIGAIRIKYEIPDEYEISSLLPHEQPEHLAANGKVVIFEEFLKNGLRFPMDRLFETFFKKSGVLPCRFKPNGYRNIASFIALCRDVLQTPATWDTFCHFFSLAGTGGRGFTLYSREKLFSGIPNSHHNPHSWSFGICFWVSGSFSFPTCLQTPKKWDRPKCNDMGPNDRRLVLRVRETPPEARDSRVLLRGMDPVTLQKEVEARLEKRRREADDAETRARKKDFRCVDKGNSGLAAHGTVSDPDMMGSLDKDREKSIKFNYHEYIPSFLENVLALKDSRHNQEILRGCSTDQKLEGFLTKHLEGAIYAASLLESSTSSRDPEADTEKTKKLVAVKQKLEASSKKFEDLYRTSSKRLEEEKARSSGLQTTVSRLESDLTRLQKAQEVSAAKLKADEEKIQALTAQVVEAVIDARDRGEEEAMSLCRRLCLDMGISHEKVRHLHPLASVKNLPDDLSQKELIRRRPYSLVGKMVEDEDSIVLIRRTDSLVGKMVEDEDSMSPSASD